MKLIKMHEKVIEDIDAFEDKEVKREDYERWLRNDLTRYMRLQLEQVYYRECRGIDVNWTEVVEHLLNEEPPFVPRVGEEGDRA